MRSPEPADQRHALELIRSTATEAADDLAATCPEGLPASLSERLGILSQVLDKVVGSLGALRPVLVSFYTSLDGAKGSPCCKLFSRFAAQKRRL
jgi:hypothetical protein